MAARKSQAKSASGEMVGRLNLFNDKCWIDGQKVTSVRC